MAEYINKALVIAYLNIRAEQTNQSAVSCAMLGAIDHINTIPTADLVDVVRCRDCKHLANRDEEGGKCWRGNGFARAMENDDYCSYGERKE